MAVNADRKMRARCHVSVAFDAGSYEHAGRILDRVDVAVREALGGVGRHDITGFETQPCKAIEFQRREQELRAELYEREQVSQPTPEPDFRAF